MSIIYRHGNSILDENLLIDNVCIMANKRQRRQIFTRSPKCTTDFRVAFHFKQSAVILLKHLRTMKITEIPRLERTFRDTEKTYVQKEKGSHLISSSCCCFDFVSVDGDEPVVAPEGSAFSVHKLAPVTLQRDRESESRRRKQRTSTTAIWWSAMCYFDKIKVKRLFAA